MNFLVEHDENRHDRYRSAANGTNLVLDCPSSRVLEKTISVAPGEGKRSIWFWKDIFCEDLAHPHLFPTGKCGYKVNREMPLNY